MSCKRCGRCCGNILPLTNAEISNIKKYIKANNIKLNENDIYCPFLEQGIISKCMIYDIRPQICREFHCNYTNEDLKNTKMFKEKRSIVNMQNEFLKYV